MGSRLLCMLQSGEDTISPLDSQKNGETFSPINAKGNHDFDLSSKLQELGNIEDPEHPSHKETFSHGSLRIHKI